MKQSQSFSFRPPLPKQVPDFKRLHREFYQKMEGNKQAQKLTTPQPFNFHEPKNDPSLRKYMDQDNQLINPTKKCLKKRCKSAKNPNRDLSASPERPNPPTTKKHEALVAMRRATQTQKINEKIDKQEEEHYRAIKQVRLTNRVKQSPAISNNQGQLKRKRAHSLQRARDQMRYLESVYDQQKALMEFNVAKRPLLVEQ